MNTSFDFADLFISLGGQLEHDRADEWWTFPVGDFEIHIEPHLSHSFAGSTLALDCAISNKEFAKLINRIFREPSGRFQCIKWESRRMEIKFQTEVETGFRKLLDDELKQVQSIDFGGLVEEFASSCPDRPSMRQVSHLAALAWKGDFKTLMDYEKTFERGFRLNFVPMITKEMIGSAVEIACERA
jgi:hypothetical protein